MNLRRSLLCATILGIGLVGASAAAAPTPPNADATMKAFDSAGKPTGKCLAANPTGGGWVLGTCPQPFSVAPGDLQSPTGQGSMIKLEPTGECLMVGGAVAGRLVARALCPPPGAMPASGMNMLWKAVPAGNQFKIKLDGTTLCLTADASRGPNLRVAPCSGLLTLWSLL